MGNNMNINKYYVNKKFQLSSVNPQDTGKFSGKKETEKILEKNIKKMSKLQDMLYAHDRYAILIIFQAMDAAGKDGMIKHVMSGLNPQGTQVFSFKQPSAEELDHDYLWRINKSLPERGRIGIFNRSYYEEVLVVRVNNLLDKQKLPESSINKNFWQTRFRQINDFEKYLFENGVLPLKFFLHISKEEQGKRFLSRIENPDKNWKFSESDLKEREHWDDYQKYYEETLIETSKSHSPWYVIPSDNKWYARVLVSEIIVNTMEKLPLHYPEVSEEKKKKLESYKEILLKQLS